MTTRVYDVTVIIGAGSIDLPAALFIAQDGLRPLISDQSASPAQGSNKAAIGCVRATGIIQCKCRVLGLRTERGGYGTEVVINAAGAWARAVARLAHLDVPVVPDSHEAGITEPVARFLEPMVVDIRPARGSKNYDFYQHRSGSLAFCITPDPPLVGSDCRETSTFLPMIARRMVELMPKLVNLKVRRAWRACSP
jgi:sarcosine oxidase subunit beta